MKSTSRSLLSQLFPKKQAQSAKNVDVSRPYRAVQIEVTSRCSTGCVFCPHDALSGQWAEGDLPLHTYRTHIVPHMELFDLVYLQGWGEPMLHPNLWEMLELAQQKGCRTGFTTNGAWFSPEYNERLLDQGINMISVSFAGQSPLVHEALRTNSNFTKLCQNFTSLANLKKNRGVDKPWLELHFLMTSVNLSEFPRLVELAASLGADEMVATNLTYSPNLALDNLHVFSNQPLAEDMWVIDRARETAKRLNLPLRIYPLQAEPRTLVCDADPLNTIYINHHGEVSACVYLGLPVMGQVPRYFQGESHPFSPVSFGSVSDGLLGCLQGEARNKFIAAIKKRRASDTPLALFSYMANRAEQEQLPLPPLPCQHCYKMLGV